MVKDKLRRRSRVWDSISKRKRQSGRRWRRTRRRKPQSIDLCHGQVGLRFLSEYDLKHGDVPFRATAWGCTSCPYREMWEEYFVYATCKGRSQYVPWSGRRCFEPRRLLADLGCTEGAVDRYWPDVDYTRTCNVCTIVTLFSCERR